MPNWKQYSLDGVFSIALPPSTEAIVEDDDSMFVLTPPGEHATDILVGLFPLEAGIKVSDEVLKSHLSDFIDRCVRGVATVRDYCVEPAADNDDPKLCVWQAIVAIEDDRFWLVRLYGWREGSQQLLVHWTGPKRQLQEVVIKAFVTLEPLFPADCE